MTSWQIDVPAARAVITSASETVTDIDTVANDHATAFDSAVACATNGPLTQAALKNVAADPLMAGIAMARRYVEFVLSATSGAIDAYVAGDLEMAETTQASIPTELR